MGYKYLLPTEGPSAQRPAGAPIGWRYYETDTKRDLLYTGLGWLKTNGPTGTLTIDPLQPGGVVNNGTAAALGAPQFTFPAGVYGPVTLKCDMMWTANNNAAAYVYCDLYQNGAKVDTVHEARIHNHASGYGVFQHLSFSGSMTPPGPGTYMARLAVSVDPGGAPIYFYDVRVWVDW